jgi:hypothetical protein
MVSAIERAGDWRRCAGCACEFKVSIRGEGGDAAAAANESPACVRCGTTYRANARHCHRCGATAAGGARSWRWGRIVLAPVVVTAAVAAIGVLGVWHSAVAPVRATQAEVMTATPALDVELRAQPAGYSDLRQKLDEAERRADAAEASLRSLRKGVDRVITITKDALTPPGKSASPDDH